MLLVYVRSSVDEDCIVSGMTAHGRVGSATLLLPRSSMVSTPSSSSYPHPSLIVCVTFSYWWSSDFRSSTVLGQFSPCSGCGPLWLWTSPFDPVDLSRCPLSFRCNPKSEIFFMSNYFAVLDKIKYSRRNIWACLEKTDSLQEGGMSEWNEYYLNLRFESWAHPSCSCRYDNQGINSSQFDCVNVRLHISIRLYSFIQVK